MAYQDQWQKASFRGVEFRFISTAASLGRRTVVHEYPDGDEAYVEDLGRKTREYTFEAFVIGSDYITWRDALEAACEEKGPGELVHPTRGRMLVSVQECRPVENINELGRSSYSLTFVRAGENTQPGTRIHTPSVVDSAADTAIGALEQDFELDFDVAGFPDFVEQDALEILDNAMQSILDTATGMLPDISILPQFTGRASGILGKLTSLLRLPGDLASSITGQIGALLGLSTGPMLAFKAFASLFGFDNKTVKRTTPSRIRQADNRVAVANLVRRTAIVEAARAASDVEFDTRNDALAVRDQLADLLEQEVATASDPVYAALTDLRVAVVRDIGTRSADLSSLGTYVPQSTVPAVVLAYRIYDDPERSEEIIRRNRIKHPGFVPGGQPLEVLV